MNELDVFTAALELADSAARVRFLDEACGERPDLRSRIEALLKNASEASRYLEPPPNDRHTEATLIRPPITEAVGSQIGPYKLREQIGEGGMGIVYVAEQERPVRRKVAFKVIKPGMDTKQVIARFEAERQALAMMDHSNIARVLDVGTTEAGRPYFVMELVKGIPITEYCDQARLSTAARLQLFLDVCRAVQHAHQKGIIHRDLKPSNVLVTEQDGRAIVKVIDFGIAKALGQQLTEKTIFTGHAQLVGTPLYMSPEQAALSAVDVDTRSDVYSLGVMLYELLTGTTPFDKETFSKASFDELRRIIREQEHPRPSARLSTLQAQALSTICDRRQVDPRRLNHEVRGELDWIVMKALEKDRARRYETASAFAADIERYLADEPVQACPPSAGYRFRKFARKNRGALTTAAVVAGALLAGTAVSAWQAVRATHAQTKANANESQALAAAKAERAAKEAEAAQRQRAEASETQANNRLAEVERQRTAVSQNLYYSDLRLGLVDWHAGNVARLSGKLLSHVPAAGASDFRGWEWYYLLALCHQEETTLMHHAMQVDSVAWSPDGRYLASTGSDGAVVVYNSTTWKVLRTWIGEHVWGAHWSPDSRRLAWTTTGPDNRCYVGHVETGEKLILLGHMGGGRSPAWSPDGKHLASAHNWGSGVRIWNSAIGSSIDVFGGARIGSMTWDPDGKLLVLAPHSQELKTWHALSGEASKTIPIMTGWNSAAWSTDGTQLALGMGTGKCLIYETTDWSVAREWDAHTGTVNAVAWHPDGSQLASSGTDPLIQLWDPATAKKLLTLRGHLNQVISLAWEPNGRRLASGSMDALVKIWPLPPAPQPRRLEGHRGSIAAIAWSEDGETVRSFGTADGTISRWNVVNGQRLGTTPVPGGKIAQFGAGDRLLAIAATDEKQLDILIRDADSGELVQTVKQATVRAAFSAFSPDASKLAVTDSKTLEIVDLRTGEPLLRWPGHLYAKLAWSPDGRLLAAAGLGEPTGQGAQRHAAWVHVFDTEKHQRILKMRHGTNWVPATAVSFSPDGQRLVSGDLNGLVEIWEIPAVHRTVSVQLHTATINALAWSPDGRRVASASADGTIRLWGPARGEELLRLDAPRAGVTHLAWSPDGRRLAAAAVDGSIQIWDATAGYAFVDSETFHFEQVHDRLSQTTQAWEAGRNDEVLEMYDQILGENNVRLGSVPRWVWQNIRRDAYAAMETGQSQQAITMYQVILRLNKNDADIHDDLGVLFAENGQLDKAIASFREAIRLQPDNATYRGNLAGAYNNLAWRLATCSDLKLRDIPRAVQLAQQAVKLKPDGSYLNTLGVCQYRAADWAAAVTTLEKGSNSFDWFFVAMAHWQLGHKEDARKGYDQAVQWMEKNAPENEELRRFRAEAEELLKDK